MLKPDGSFLGQFKVEGWGGRDVSDKPYLEALKDGRVAVGLPGKNTVGVYDRSGALQGTVTAPEDPLNRPYGIAETSDGKVWISEGGSGRLRLFTLP
jgi:hypothetical protein